MECSSSPWLVALAATGLILFGFLPLPRDFVFDAGALWPNSAMFISSWLAFVIQLAALWPFALVLLFGKDASIYPWRMGILLGWLILPISLFVTLFATALSGGGALFVLLKGVFLAMALSGTLFWMSRSRLSRAGRMLTWAVLAVPTGAAAWSLLNVPVVLASAYAIADGKPFCLARHEDGPSPVTNPLDLRGFSFFTMLTGYKDSSRWYFHGVMLVASSGGDEVYDWSPRRQRFDLVKNPGSLLANVETACQPGEAGSTD